MKLVRNGGKRKKVFKKIKGKKNFYAEELCLKKDRNKSVCNLQSPEQHQGRRKISLKHAM